MRKTDHPIPHEEVRQKVEARRSQTLGGLIIVVGGVAVALLSLPDIKMVVIGFLVALLGAGIVHPDMVVNFLRGRNGA